MKYKLFYCFFPLLIISCDRFYQNTDLNTNGYRDGSETGILINNSSLVGEWEETYSWNNAGGEYPSYWNPVNINNSEKYIFLDDKTFTSENTINNCSQSSGTYVIEGSKISLLYNCDQNTTKEVVINEFFFREKHIVFIKGEGTYNISKYELIK